MSRLKIWCANSDGLGRRLRPDASLSAMMARALSSTVALAHRGKPREQGRLANSWATGENHARHDDQPQSLPDGLRPQKFRRVESRTKQGHYFLNGQ